MLNTKKCMALHTSGCVDGLVDWIEMVMEGKTAYSKFISVHNIRRIGGTQTYQGNNEHICHSKVIYAICLRNTDNL